LPLNRSRMSLSRVAIFITSPQGYAACETGLNRNPLIAQMS
jgi:hypothetical protein